MDRNTIKTISERIGAMTERLQAKGWWEVCPTAYWAHHPVLAMRAIVNSGQDPTEFVGQDVN